MRRYNDFELLREHLQHSWVGFYIAPLPPKQAIGNMEASFINERLV